MVLFWRLYIGGLFVVVIAMELTGLELPAVVRTVVGPVVIAVSLVDQLGALHESRIRWPAR